MPINKKVFVSIYCKIYTDNFSDEMVNRMASGQDIYEFLIKDAGQCFDESGNLLPGDCNLWYLGCNEKFGHLQLEFDQWSWSFGESSFDNMEACVSALYQKKLISGVQFHILMGKIDEGRQINNMYHIRDYLIYNRDRTPWTKDSDTGKFRDDIKQMIGDVEKSFQKNGYRVFL
jgi:hypothetical protein